MSTTCLNSAASRPQINVPNIKTAVSQGQFLTPTLRARSPLVCHSDRKTQSASRDRNSLHPPSFLFPYHQHRSSPSSPRNIQDRLIPCRSQTNIELAQHLLSPMSYRPGDDDNEQSDPEQQESRRQVTRILNFGTKISKTTAKPLTLVTTSFTTAVLKSKCKIPTKPDRVMAAPGTFLECGSQSAHWAPSTNIVVALESGVYVYKINEDCNVSEIRNNVEDPDYPYCYAIWNNDGHSVICGKVNGEIQICDIRHPDRGIKWNLTVKQALRSIAMEQEHLLTCGTVGKGVRIYDIRQSSGFAEPILAMKARTSVNSLSWSPNGHLLAGGCESGVTNLWDIRHPDKTLTCLKTQEKNPVQAVNWCSWKPSILLSGSSFPRPSICLQNTATGVLLGEYECASEVTSIQFNAQLKQVATSHHSSPQDVPESRVIHGTESSVQLWQVNSSKMTPVLELDQHVEGIVSMAASPNSNQLLTMGGDELLCLWYWNETGTHPVQAKSGTLTARSQLDALNLIR